MGEKRAVILLSGGLDSTTTLAIAKNDGYILYGLTFDYSQRHDKELISAKKIADYYNIEKHLILKIELDKIGGSSLTDKEIIIPSRNLDEIENEIPNTYVPGRNIIFLSYTLSWAEVIKAKAIYIGANSIDYSGYPDCRPEFFKAFQNISKFGTKIGVSGKPVKIITPLINLSKSEIIKKGIKLDVPYELTWSCYRGTKKACGTCDSCLLRLKGFKESGINDPIEYQQI